MKQGKNIKIYTDLASSDDSHNDILLNAFQLYDGNFGDSVSVNNFQDVINKRVVAISHNDGTTSIGGDLYISGDTTGPTVTDIYSKLSNLLSRVGALENVSNDLWVKGTLRVDGITTLKSNVSAERDLSVGGNLTVNGLDIKNAIDTLNGSASVTNSVRNIVATYIAELVAGADASFDTLKEIADWIIQHSSDAAQMNSTINSNTTRIKALEDANYGASIASNTARIKALEDADFGGQITNIKNNYATNANLNALEARVTALEGLWKLSNGQLTPTNASRGIVVNGASTFGSTVTGAGFYDSTM